MQKPQTATNFLVATIDSDFNMFKRSETGDTEFVVHIAEHVKRLEEISDGHHFYIDDIAFEALGQSGFPLRFTRVFSKTPEKYKMSTGYRLHNISDLEQAVKLNEMYSKDVQIFFIGSSDFLKQCSKWSKKMLLTVAKTTTDEGLIVDKFPLEWMQGVYKRRRDIKPELLETIKKYKQIKLKQVPKQTTEIADNGMIVKKTVEMPAISIEDKILSTPDYMFYEFRK